MPAIQVLFLAFGPRTDIHRQIYFAIRSVQQYDCPRLKLNIVTDAPERFARLGDDVRLHVLSKDDISNWRGRHDFVFRVKIKAIELIANTFPEDHTLFLDSDTTMEANPEVLVAMLDKQHTIMHLNEKVIAQSKDPADKALTTVLNGFSHKDFHFTTDTCMFNSGVVGLPAGLGTALMADSIALSDAMCDTPVDRSFVEQLAIGMVLAKNSQLQTCEHTVLHYWGNKPQWDALIDNFIIDCALNNLSKADEIAKLAAMDLKRIPIKARSQINNQRLKSLADKLFPKRREHFFTAQ